MKKNESTKFQNMLDKVYTNVGANLRRIHGQLSKIGRAKNTSFFIVATVPVTEEDNSYTRAIGYEGNALIAADAILKRYAKGQDKEFNQFVDTLCKELEKRKVTQKPFLILGSEKGKRK